MRKDKIVNDNTGDGISEAQGSITDEGGKGLWDREKSRKTNVQGVQVRRIATNRTGDQEWGTK